MPPDLPERDISDIVLIVDDVPENLSLLHDALDEAGYTVLVATHGEAALHRARQSLPDVILLDVFNSLGLPTSTTVSLVFELLGAAVAVALFSIWQANGGDLVQYINSGKALAIISGIFVSIAIAFVMISSVITPFTSQLLSSVAT